MKISTNKEWCIATTDVNNINNKEMRQMHDLKCRIKAVLASHKTNKKEYISDDDLKLAYAILNVFTKEYSNTQTSAFDDELKEIDKEQKNPEQSATVEDDDNEILI